MATTKIVTRPKPDASGTLPIYLRITHRGKTRYLSLSLRVKPRQFNAAAGRLRKSAPDHARLNEYFARIEGDAQTAIADLLSRGEPLSARAVREMVRPAPEQYAPPDFLAYCEELLAGYEGRGQIATWKAYRTAVRKLRTFTSGRLAFDEVTPGLVRRFQAHLSSTNKPNTVHKNITSLRTMYQQAIREERIAYGPNPFKAVTLKKERSAKTKISSEDLRRVRDLPLEPGSLLARVRDWFLFAFFAGGMRFSDVATLRREHIRQDEAGAWRAYYKMQKTGDEVYGALLVGGALEALERCRPEWRALPPGGYVFGILEHYDTSTARALHVAIGNRNALANKYLREIAERAGVPAFSFHMSRHSAAGFLLEQGADVYTIQQVLGHSSVQVTEAYLAGFRGTGTDDAMRGLGEL